MNRPLILIVVAQLLGTSLWFTGNSAAADLKSLWKLSDAEQGYLLMAVQGGFIVGTLMVALTGFADRFRASRIFAVATVCGSLANAGFALLSEGVPSAIVFRFLTGLSLAGIYPLGMKLVVGWEPTKSGQALGWLVGALTLGTATPHLVRATGEAFPWQVVVLTSSVLALGAGVIVFLLGDGPHLPAPRRALAFGGVMRAFSIRELRASAFGYFGHMWELYAFWNLLPALVALLLEEESNTPQNRSLISFFAIAVGSLGCVLGGWCSLRVGSGRVAFCALAVSGLCCLLYPWGYAAGLFVGLPLLLVWGFTVVADSPQFSALSARACPREVVGSVLAIQNSIGFFITILSINLTSQFVREWKGTISLMLLPGPILGLIGMWGGLRSDPGKGAG